MANISKAERNKQRAFELAAGYFKEFYNPFTHELLFDSPNSKGLATCWEYIGLMEMTDKLAFLDGDNIPLLNNVIKGLEYYAYQDHGEFTGYVVNRGKAPRAATDPGMAYDDNMWIIINFTRAFEITGNIEYLNKAEHLANYLIENAWFEPLGGFFWDSRKGARHSCSNNPFLKPLCDLYKHTGRERYLEWAMKTFDFSVNNLKDNKLGIYEDFIGARQKKDGTWQEGNPSGTGFYTYNTGTMISGGVSLYEATGDKKYLAEAMSSAKSAFEYFGDKTVKEGYVGLPVSSTIWFNAILLKGMIELYPYAKTAASRYIGAYQKSMDYAYKNYLKDGFMPVDWLTGWRDGVDMDVHKRSLDQSANVEMYALLSIFESRVREKPAEKIKIAAC